MTKYEEDVTSGKNHCPMNGMDWIMFGMVVEDCVNGKDELDAELIEIFDGMQDEIDYYYKDQPAVIEKLNLMIKKFKDIK